MNREQHSRAKEHFLELRELSIDEQTSRLHQLRENDAELAELVAAMLAAESEDPDFLKTAGFRHRGALESLYGRHAGGYPTTIGTDDSVSESNSHELPARIGAYDVIRVLGQGGMGTVYLAEQHEPVRRQVAVKVIKLGMDTEQVLQRFEAERQALALMEHPSIARVIDAGATDDGRPYFAMEYVDGVPLTEFCQTKSLPLRARLALFQQLCRAVQHAHSKGIIHRDLKPGNILVATDGDEPRAVVIDFGLARATDFQLTAETMFTEHGQTLGTPEYMSPEQAGLGGLDIDTRTDIYSLGVVLYELLAGVLPFSSEELRRAGFQELQRVIREVDPPKPSTRILEIESGTTSAATTESRESHIGVREVRGDLDWIVLKAMEKDRARRYATASEFALDLQRYLDHEPVLASPPSFAYRARKFARRYRVQVVATALLLITFLAGVAGTGWFALDAHRRNQQLQVESEATVMRRAQKEIERFGFGLINDQDLERWQSAGFAGRWLTPRAVLKEDHSIEARGIYWGSDPAPNGESLLLFAHGWGLEPNTERWNPKTGERTLESPRLTSVARHTPDGSRVIAGIVVPPGLCRLIAYDPSDPETILESVTLDPKNPQSPILALSIAPRADRLVALMQSGSVWVGRVSNLADGRLLEMKTRGGDVAIHPDGSRIAAPGKPGLLEIRDFENGELLQEIAFCRVARSEGPHEIVSIDWSPRGDSICMAGEDGRVGAWSLADGLPLSDFTPHTSEFSTGRQALTVAVHPDGWYAASGGSDRVVRIHDLSTGRTIASESSGGIVTAVRFTADGTRLVVTTATPDEPSALWKTDVWPLEDFFLPLELVGHAPRDPQQAAQAAYAVATSPDGKFAYTTGSASLMKWDLSSGEPVFIRRAGVGSLDIDAIGVSPDGSQLAIGGYSPLIEILDAASGKIIDRILLPPGWIPHTPGGAKFACRSLAWTADGNQLVAGFGTPSLERPDLEIKCLLIDVATHAKRPLGGHRFSMTDVATHPTEPRAATAGYLGEVQLWDLSTDPPTAILAKEAVPGVGSMAFLDYTEDGERLLVAQRQGQVSLHDARSGKILAGATHAILGAIGCEVSGGQALLSCTTRTLVLEHRFGNELLRFEESDDHIWAAAWVGDGLGFITTATGAEVRFHETVLRKGRLRERQANRRAGEWLRAAYEALAERNPVTSEVRTWIDAQDGISEDTRQRVRRLLDRTIEFGLLNDRAWEIVTDLESSPESVAVALDWARIAAEGENPDLWTSIQFRDTLGVALWRAGEFDEAIALLEQINVDCFTHPRRPSRLDWQGIVSTRACLGLAYFANGERDLARDWLERAWRSIGSSRVGHTDLRLLAELESALGIPDRGLNKPPFLRQQLTGPPDAHQLAGMSPTHLPQTWAPKEMNSPDEWMELRYAVPVEAARILIYESFGPGGVSRVIATDIWGGEHQLFQGVDPTGQFGIFEVAVPSDTPPIQKVRVEIDSSRHPHRYEQFDTVGLVGTDGRTRWPASAEVSSEIGE